MTFAIPTGSNNEKQDHQDHQDRLWLCVVAGLLERVIYLNGGSETRRDIRDYYREKYHGSNLFEVVDTPFKVTIRARR